MMERPGLDLFAMICAQRSVLGRIHKLPLRAVNLKAGPPEASSRGIRRTGAS
jgi:hypothetical protein